MMIKAFKSGMTVSRDATSKMMKASSIKVEQEQKQNPLKRAGINRMSVAISNVAGTSDMKHKNPKNIVSGLGYGGLAFAKGIVFGITGVVTEPVKGGMKKGPKGAAVGLGKGFVGLFAKPIGGTVGLVGCTV